jgi:hypothetical protein
MVLRVNPRPDRLDIAQARKGCLESRTARTSKLGVSDLFIPEGSVGYVLSARSGHYLVLWPTFLEATGRRPITGSHSRDDMTPTGRRG